MKEETANKMSDNQISEVNQNLETSMVAPDEKNNTVSFGDDEVKEEKKSENDDEISMKVPLSTNESKPDLDTVGRL